MAALLENIQCVEGGQGSSPGVEIPGAKQSSGIVSLPENCASLIPAHTWAIPQENHCGVQRIVIPRGNYVKVLEEASKQHSCSGRSAQTMKEHLKTDNFIFLYKHKIPAGQAGKLRSGKGF